MTWNDQFCMAKKRKKNTVIQGNFYERLHFYMDSCAISPTASSFDVVHPYAILIAHKNFPMYQSRVDHSIPTVHKVTKTSSLMIGAGFSLACKMRCTSQSCLKSRTAFGVLRTRCILKCCIFCSNR